MKLLRGLGGLITTVLMFIVIGNTLQAETETVNPTEAHVGLAIAQAIIQMESHAKEILTREATEPGKVDPDTVALTEALINFAADLISSKNAWAYVKDQFTALFAAILEKIPYFMQKPSLDTAENLIGAIAS